MKDHAAHLARKRAYYARNREAIVAKSRERQRAHYAAHPEIHRQYRINSAERQREWHLRKSYGIDLAQYERMLAQQNGSCAICRHPGPRSKYNHFRVDHDHKTGRLRGLLCDWCNKALGLFEDDQERLAAASRYLHANS